MACPRCRLHLQLSRSRPGIRVPRRRTFHTTPTHQRGQLGAATYPQEWQTGTYHFNKATQKSLPVAATHADTLLSQWLTQQKKRHVSDSAAYQLMLRSSVAAQRRKSDRIFVSKSTVKDFGDRMEVNAFVFDGVEAAAKEEERRKKAKMGVKPEDGAQGGRRKRRARLRPLGGAESGQALPAVRRPGGLRSRAPGSQPAGAGFRTLNLGRPGGARVARTAGGVAPRG